MLNLDPHPDLLAVRFGLMVCHAVTDLNLRRRWTRRHGYRFSMPFRNQQLLPHRSKSLMYMWTAVALKNKRCDPPHPRSGSPVVRALLSGRNTLLHEGSDGRDKICLSQHHLAPSSRTEIQTGVARQIWRSEAIYTSWRPSLDFGRLLEDPSTFGTGSRASEARR